MVKIELNFAQNWHNGVAKASGRLQIRMGRSYDFRDAVEMPSKNISHRVLESTKSPKHPSSKGVIYKKQLT